MRYITPPKLDIDKLTDEFKQYLATLRTNTGKVSFERKFEEIPDKTKVTIPQVYITAEAWLKMNALVQECTDEIAWQACVKKVDYTDGKGFYYLVHKVLVYPQTVTGTFVDTDEVAYTEWSLELDENTYNSIRFQGHSHVNMGVTPSGTDQATYDGFLQQLGKDDFYIFLILNKRQEYTLIVYDFAQNIIFDTADCVFDIVTSDGMFLSRWTEENMKQVTKKVTTHVTYGYNNNYGYGHYGYDSDYHAPKKGVITFANQFGYRKDNIWTQFENDTQKVDFFIKRPDLMPQHIDEKTKKQVTDRLALMKDKRGKKAKGVYKA